MNSFFTGPSIEETRQQGTSVRAWVGALDQEPLQGVDMPLFAIGVEVVRLWDVTYIHLRFSTPS